MRTLHNFSHKIYFYCWKKLKNMYFHSKMVWPPATYDIISRNHRNLPSLNLTQNCARGMNEQLLKTSGADVLSFRKKELRKTLYARGLRSKTTSCSGTSTEATSSQLEAMTAQSSHAPSPLELKFVREPSNDSGKLSFIKDCRFCDQTHEKERSKCPTFGKICSACQKRIILLWNVTLARSSVIKSKIKCRF